jgi:hypothetical protein
MSTNTACFIDNWTKRFDLTQLTDAIWAHNKGVPLSDDDRAAALRAGEAARLAGGGNVRADVAMQRFVRDLRRARDSVT